MKWLVKWARLAVELVALFIALPAAANLGAAVTVADWPIAIVMAAVIFGALLARDWARDARRDRPIDIFLQSVLDDLKLLKEQNDAGELPGQSEDQTKPENYAYDHAGIWPANPDIGQPVTRQLFSGVMVNAMRRAGL